MRKIIGGMIMLIGFAFAIILFAKDYEKPAPPKVPTSEIEIVQTAEFITLKNKFTVSKAHNEIIQEVQEATEQWMREHPEYEVKDMSTSQHAGSVFVFCITLRISKKSS